MFESVQTRSRFQLSGRIVLYFASAGFILTWALLGIYTLADRTGHYLNTDVLAFLCPPSIMSMALDGASTINALICWFIFSLENAIIYAIVGFFIALIIACVAFLRKR
jgi:uncharacterized membrane protein YciS (DUF1049 family)